MDAALFLAPDRNGTTFYGRYAANEGLIHALAKYTKGDTLHCCSPTPEDIQACAPLLLDCGKNISRLRYFALGMPMANINSVVRFDPNLTDMTWHRRAVGADSKLSICGLTHSLSSIEVNRWIGDTIAAPLHPWDAMVCTSQAARKLIQNLRQSWGAYLAERVGAKVFKPHDFMLPIIPLGVDAAAFQPKPNAPDRNIWRARLGVGEQDVLVLFFGRLSYTEKCNPVPMYIALEQAAKESGVKLHLVQAGRFPKPEDEALYKNAAATFMPSVPMHWIEGGSLGVEHLWHAADIFTSLSDNIQETFGLTPVEAMAAGLPVVVSDWDGYRDTIADGEVGFRIPTLWPPAGDGEELAAEYGYSDNYFRTIAKLSQTTAVDVGKAAAAFTALAKDPALRKRMGEAGRERVRQHYDWPVIAAQWEELWAEQRRIREKAKPVETRFLPHFPDPYKAFAGFPTGAAGDKTIIRRHADWQGRLARALSDQLARINAPALDVLPENGLQALLAGLPEPGAALSKVLAGVPAESRPALRQLLVWAAKLGVVELAG